jgi:hypothetical protein
MHRPANVGLNGSSKPLLRRNLRVDVVKTWKHVLEQQLDARTFPRALEFGGKRRLHRASAFVAQHHEELRLEVYGRELEACPDLRGNDVSRHTNNEQIAEFRIEDQFRRYARVAAAKDACKWALAFDKAAERLQRLLRRTGLAAEKALVASHQTREGLIRVG